MRAFADWRDTHFEPLARRAEQIPQLDPAMRLKEASVVFGQVEVLLRALAEPGATPTPREDRAAEWAGAVQVLRDECARLRASTLLERLDGHGRATGTAVRELMHLLNRVYSLDLDVHLPTVLSGRWRLGRMLGEGGQGRVYVVHPLAGGVDAVIKLLLRQDDYTLERFRREVAAMASISHPNVLRILEHGTDPVPFYVAPLGVPLEEYWSVRRASCDPSQLFDLAARLIEQLAGGLAAVHAQGLVHRDIKPANVIIVAEVPVLADFGIVHDPAAERITTRPAGNGFARNIASIYDPSLAPASGDCLCLANLWAWLLRADPQLKHHGNYHWRFHEFVDDPRCEIARTTLALCSEPASCPKDGAAFLTLLSQRYALSKLTKSPNRAPNDAVVAAHALAVAKRDQQQVALSSEIEVIARAITPMTDHILAALRDSFEELSQQSLPVKARPAPVPTLTADDLARAILDAERTRGEFQLAQLTCGSDAVMDFGVAVRIVWHVYPHEDLSKFSLYVHYFHEAASEIDAVHSKYYKALPTGELEDFEPTVVAERIRTFFRDADMWTHRTKPRLRGQGSFFG